MKLHTLAGFDRNTLRPLSPAQVARRAHIAAEMQFVAKASESALPSDEQRQVIDLHEMRRCISEMAMACIIAAPISCAYVLVQVL